VRGTDWTSIGTTCRKGPGEPGFGPAVISSNTSVGDGISVPVVPLVIRLEFRCNAVALRVVEGSNLGHIGEIAGSALGRSPAST